MQHVNFSQYRSHHFQPSGFQTSLLTPMTMVVGTIQSHPKLPSPIYQLKAEVTNKVHEFMLPQGSCHSKEKSITTS
jgi:hypothetical protein